MDELIGGMMLANTQSGVDFTHLLHITQAWGFAIRHLSWSLRSVSSRPPI